MFNFLFIFFLVFGGAYFVPNSSVPADLQAFHANYVNTIQPIFSSIQNDLDKHLDIQIEDPVDVK